MSYPSRRIRPTNTNPQVPGSSRIPLYVPNNQAVRSSQSPNSHDRTPARTKNKFVTPPIPPYSASRDSIDPNATSSSPFASRTSNSSSHSQVDPRAWSPSHTHSPPNPPYPLGNQGTNLRYDSGYPATKRSPLPERWTLGFRRVRTVHDLRPHVDDSSMERRMTADGIYLSVSSYFLIAFFTYFSFTAPPPVDHPSRRNVSHLQPPVRIQVCS